MPQLDCPNLFIVQIVNEAGRSSVLLKPWFWVFFIIIIIISLYLYGLHILEDRTELTQTKRTLEITSQNLKNCTEDNLAKTKEISEQQIEINRLSASITQNNYKITQLNDSILKLVNRPPEIEYKDRIVYKERPETYHPFGKGFGKLSIYKKCNCYSLDVSVDGVYWGRLTDVFTNSVYCDQDGALTKIVMIGSHHIEGKDEEGHHWNFYATVAEDQCKTLPLNLRTRQ